MIGCQKFNDVIFPRLSLWLFSRCLLISRYLVENVLAQTADVFRYDVGDTEYVVIVEIHGALRLKHTIVLKNLGFFVHLINGNLGLLKCSLYPLSMCSLVAMVTVSAHVARRVILLGGIHFPKQSNNFFLLKLALILICEMRCVP